MKKILLTATVCAVGMMWIMNASAQTPTPERCFQWNHKSLYRIATDAWEQVYVIENYDQSCGSNVVIPTSIQGNNVQVIGYNSFANKNIKTVTFLNDSIEIDPHAFANNNISTIKIKNNPDNAIMGNIRLWCGAFYNNNLENLSIELRTMTNGMIWGNKDYIPNNLECKGTFADNAINSLELKEASWGNNFIPEYAFENNNIKTVKLPNNIESIRESAFKNNEINSISFPKTNNYQYGLTIGKNAFESNNIKNLDFPKYINFIDNNAFKNNVITDITSEYFSHNLTQDDFTSVSYTTSNDPIPFRNYHWDYYGTKSSRFAENVFVENCLSDSTLNPTAVAYFNKFDEIKNKLESESYWYSDNLKNIADWHENQKTSCTPKNKTPKKPQEPTEWEKFSDKISNLPNINNITISDENTINNLLSEYNSLSDTEKAKVNSISLQNLQSLKNKIEELKKAQNSQGTNNNSNTNSQSNSGPGGGGNYNGGSASPSTTKSISQPIINTHTPATTNTQTIPAIETTTITENKSNTNTTTVILYPKFVANKEKTVTTLTDKKLIPLQERFNATTEKTRNEALTRGEFLKIVIEASNINIDNVDSLYNRYYDVKIDDTYAKYILYATNNNIVSGYHDNTFRANATITRAEATKILVQSLGIKLAEKHTKFKDVDKNNTLAQYIQTAFDNYLVNGVNNVNFEPNRSISRGELIKIIYNILN